jgi:hypothetical protein
MRRAGTCVVTLLLLLPLLTACESDWTCPGCLHDANIRIEDAAGYVGHDAHVRIVSAGGRVAQRTVRLVAEEQDITFTDYIREGGGPYDTFVFLDLDDDGTCDESDGSWRESFDDDETLWVVDAGDPQSICP